MEISMPIPANVEFTHIAFSVGVDSLTNESGVFGGDLDPTNGMYWTWQSGYINFKLEGKSVDCPARQNRFQFHIGGYLAPYYALRNIELAATYQSTIEINMNLDTLFDAVDLKEQYQIMSPSAVSQSFADLFTTLFSIAQ